MAKDVRSAQGPTPEILSVSDEELAALLASLRSLLPGVMYERVSGLLQTLQWVLIALQKKNTTLAWLQRLVFGISTEKTAKVFPQTLAPDPLPKERRKGHGRNGADQYAGAQRVAVSHPNLKPGEACPACQNDQAKVGLRQPSRIVTVTAQPIFAATIFALEQLRCNHCGKVYTAPAPPAATSKYDPTVGVMLGLLRFGCGLPHYRIEQMQRDLGVPLPQSTQWELMEESTGNFQPIREELITVAAGGELLHNDDTSMRVQSLKKERAAAGSERTGIFTTSIISQAGPRSIALFFTGGNHAGENLDLVLKNRGAGLGKPIQMCDALARNLPKDFEVLLSNCLPHGRRNFVDVAEHFPVECQKVLASLAQVFGHDAQCKKLQLEPERRLAFHQEHSQPVLEELQAWMREQVEQKKVEPNSGLGKAIAYMQNHWEPLTLFLRHPGAPLSNNICERALKTAILHRKNSLSYKTANGARIGDLFMSLIHTCRLNGANPFDYLTKLQSHASAIKANPSQWLPWNYRETIATLESG